MSNLKNEIGGMISNPKISSLIGDGMKTFKSEIEEKISNISNMINRSDQIASEFHQNNRYKIEGNSLTNIEMADYLIELSAAYPIVSIEDGLAEDDWEGWKYLTSKIGDRTQLVGDDLFVTQEKILQKGINDKCANSVLIKVNQVGSISETIETMQLAKENNYTSMVSHRSGETEDAFISHLVVGTSSGQIKTGAPARGERTAKYNELLRISEQVGSDNFDNQKWQK